MYKILLPTDFSEASINALHHAIEIAKVADGKIILLHVQSAILFPDDIPLALQDELLEKILSDIPKQLSVLEEKLEKEHISFETISELGYLIEEIETICTEHKIDLVVSGTSHHIFENILKTNSLRIVKGVQCPVLVVPSESKVIAPKKILFATEFNEADKAKIARIKKFADKVSATIIVGHVNTDTAHYYQDQEKQLELEKSLNVSEDEMGIVFTTIHNTDVANGLIEYLVKAEIDLICINLVKKSLLEKLISSKIEEKLILNTAKPILVYHSE